MPNKATLQSLITKTQRRYIEVEIHGDLYRIQSLTAMEWIDFNSTENRPQIEIIQFCLVDDDGSRLIPDGEPTAWLCELDSQISHQLMDACWNHLSPDMKDVQDTAKN